MRLLRRPVGQRSLGSLLVVRFLLVANGIVLLAVAGLYAAFGAKPGGLAVAGVLVAAAALLFALVPLTDPYRRRRR